MRDLFDRFPLPHDLSITPAQYLERQEALNTQLKALEDGRRLLEAARQVYPKKSLVLQIPRSAVLTDTSLHTQGFIFGRIQVVPMPEGVAVKDDVTIRVVNSPWAIAVNRENENLTVIGLNGPDRVPEEISLGKIQDVLNR